MFVLPPPKKAEKNPIHVQKKTQNNTKTNSTDEKNNSRDWNLSYIVGAKHKFHDSVQQQKVGISEGLASSIQDKDTLARGLRIMRDSTKAITGRKQIFEPVVKGTLHTYVTRNPMNKQITYKHCKSPQLCRRSSEAICSYKKTFREQQRFRAKSHFPVPVWKIVWHWENKAQRGLTTPGGYGSAVSLTTGQHHGKAKAHKPYLDCQHSKKSPDMGPPLAQASWYEAPVQRRPVLFIVAFQQRKYCSKYKNQMCWHEGSKLPSTKSPAWAERKRQGFR